MAIARITDIKGLVTLDGDSGEEILKNRDQISEHGGLLTINEFAKIFFEDGREVEVTGPVSFNLDTSFFNEVTFEDAITQISDLASLEYINNELDVITDTQAIDDNLNDQNTSNIDTTAEQLDTTLNNTTTEQITPTDVTTTVIQPNENNDNPNIEPEIVNPDNVNTPNMAPQLSVELSKVVDEDGNTTITYSATDIDGSVSVTASADHGVVVVNNDGTITYTPDANYNGVDTIEVTATDDDGTTTIKTSSITVNDVNDAPTLNVESTKVVDEDGNTTITYSATDIDGSVSVTASADHGVVVVNNDGTITYTPDANYNGVDTIEVTATDDDGTTTIKTSSITVNDVNDAPTLNVESTKVVDEDGNTTITYSATDIDGSVSVTASADHGVVVVNNDGTITYTPDANYNGVDTIEVTATDDDGTTTIKTSSITVNDVNDAPTLNVESTKVVDEDGNTTITYSATDIDGSVSVTASADHGVVVVNNDGTITYTPDANYNGVDTIEVTATDDDGTTTIKTSSITVNDVNDAPTLNVESTKVVDEDGNTTITYSATDIDGSVSVTASADHGVVVVNNDGTITYTPDANYNGVDTIEVTATDDDGTTTIKTSSITVNDVNDAPTLNVESTKVVDEDGNTTITYSATDIDGSVSVTASADHGVVVVNNDGTITYTPDPDYNGTDTITVTATDDTGATTVKTSTVTVNNVNDILFVDDFNDGTEEGWSDIGYAREDNHEYVIHGDTTAYKTFDFGEENAGKEVTISFNASKDGALLDLTSDYFSVKVNGDTVPSIDRDTSIDDLYSFNATVGADGTIDLEMITDSSFLEGLTSLLGLTSNAVTVDNITIQENGDDWIRTDELKNLVESDYNYWKDGEVIDGTTDSDFINIGDGNNKVINAGEGNDTINTYAGDGLNEYIDGGSGVDKLIINDEFDDGIYKYQITENPDGTYFIEKIGYDSNTQWSMHQYEVTVDSIESIQFNDTTVNIGTLVDGVVVGAYYETSSGISGYTNENGNFTFMEGDSVTFSVGGVVLGTATAEDIASGKTFLQDIADVERTDLNDEYLENMAVFLQSIDTADSGDNIVITQAIRDALADVTIDLTTATEEEVKDLIESIGGDYVDESTAMQHVQEMLEEYAGIDSSEFDEHISDDIQNAVLGNEPQAGIEYTTSSGFTGVTSENGTFMYSEGDEITFSKDGEVISTFDSNAIGNDSLITLNELETLNSNEIDFDNLELDFDNINEILDSEDNPVYEKTEEELEDSDLVIEDMLTGDESEASLSNILGESETDKNIGTLDEIKTDNEASTDDGSADEYCPFKTLEESSSNLISTIQLDDTIDTDDHNQ